MSPSPRLQEQERLLAEPGPVLVAFSGGGDSTALLHLVRDALGPERLLAGVVDHAAREGSAAEAELAARRAAGLGVRAHVLTLDWADGARKTQASFRRRRYAALCELARGEGARLIAVAHTIDDQAETVLMRTRRTTEARSLAAMAPIAPAPLWPEGRGVCLVRPLLGATRAELRAWLRARGAEWIEDPSNENFAFERVRARRALAGDPDKVKRFAEEAMRLRADADACVRAAANWIAAHVRLDAGRAFLPRSALAGAAPARGLSALVAAGAGTDGEPQAARVATLADEAAKPSFRGATLGGVQLKLRGEEVEICRDPGGLLGRGRAKAQIWLDLPAGAAFVWDGRLELSAPAPGWRVAASAAPPDPTAPVLAWHGRAFSLPEARARGLEATWLIAAHLAHLLPQFSRAKFTRQ